MRVFFIDLTNGDQEWVRACDMDFFQFGLKYYQELGIELLVADKLSKDFDEEYVIDFNEFITKYKFRPRSFSK